MLLNIFWALFELVIVLRLFRIVAFFGIKSVLPIVSDLKVKLVLDTELTLNGKLVFDDRFFGFIPDNSRSVSSSILVSESVFATIASGLGG